MSFIGVAAGGTLTLAILTSQQQMRIPKTSSMWCRTSGNKAIEVMITPKNSLESLNFNECVKDGRACKQHKTGQIMPA